MKPVPPIWRFGRLLYGQFRRIIRWEFWPTLPLYLPVLPAIFLAALRHRSVSVVTAVNPSIPSGGFVMHSKSAILSGLEKSGKVAAFRTISEKLVFEERLKAFHDIVTELKLSYPIVLKPDYGERGSGVTIAKNEAMVHSYLSEAEETTIVQKHIPGVEYGVFYERHPDESTGRITGITKKSITQVTGDGIHTLEYLILSDPRAVCQAPIFLELQKDRLHEIIPEGEAVSLNLIGTHSRGSLFLDACDTLTPEMETAIDVASQHFEGFYFGRYDIRCPSLEALQRGEEFWIVELNGVTSEPTHMYDPRHSVFYAWRTLSAQWTRAYDIAAANRKRGAHPMHLREVISRIKQSSEHKANKQTANS